MFRLPLEILKEIFHFPRTIWKKVQFLQYYYLCCYIANLTVSAHKLLLITVFLNRFPRYFSYVLVCISLYKTMLFLCSHYFILIHTLYVKKYNLLLNGLRYCPIHTKNHCCGRGLSSLLLAQRARVRSQVWSILKLKFFSSTVR